jgi:hypothetical protein
VYLDDPKHLAPPLPHLADLSILLYLISGLTGWAPVILAIGLKDLLYPQLHPRMMFCLCVLSLICWGLHYGLPNIFGDPGGVLAWIF